MEWLKKNEKNDEVGKKKKVKYVNEIFNEIREEKSKNKHWKNRNEIK